MNNQINQYQQRLFNKLFATLPSVRKAKEFNKDLNLDVEINHFYCFKKEDFWFTRGEKEDKYLFLFGIRDKPIKDIRGNDACLIIDFDSNVQFNDSSLGLFSIKNGEISILINYKILKEKYPYINPYGLKITNFKSFDNSVDLEVLVLGNLSDDFIHNLEKLIKAAHAIKSTKDANLENNDENMDSLNVKKDSDICKICSKKKSDFKIDSRLMKLKDIRPELCGKCIEKIFASEFFTKISPLLNGNNTKEINVAKEKFGNDELFDMGIKLLEKYEIIRFIGVKNLFYTLDRDSYLVKKFIKYSDKNNLLIDDIVPINESKPKSNPIKDKAEKTVVNNDSENYDVVKQMEMVIEAIGNGKSRAEAAELANIPEYKIVHWYNEGRQGNKPENVSFFKRLRELENINKTKNKEFHKINYVLNEFKHGKNISQIKLLNENDVENWIEKGKHDEWPYSYFYEQYKSIIEKEIIEYKIKEINRKIFLENLKAGKSREESAKNADIDFSLIDNWYLKGSENKEPFVEFYNKYLEIERNKKQIPKLAKTDSFGNHIIISQMNMILEDLTNGISEEEAIKHANVSEKTYNYWLNRGKQEFGDLYIQFYHYINQIKYEFNDDEILEEGPENRLIDTDIYAPLPQEYESSFSSMNQSGIAWVNQIGNKWYYTKSVNGKNIRLSGEDIYELFNRVKKEKQIWGIRDYSKASKYLDFPDDFAIPVRPQIEEMPDDEPIEIDPDIYAPLPEEYEKSFNHTAMNRTGIAWVNHIGNQWIYSKKIDGETKKITDTDIYGLHRKVKAQNQIWGIRDYGRAKEIINIPDDFEIPSKPKIHETKGAPVELSSDILAPLPKEYLSPFNPNQKNKTGIAWVNKVGKKWLYQRRVNGVDVKFSENDIHKLHKTVIINNQIWGILDFDKAKSVIESGQIKEEHNDSEPQISTKRIYSSNVVVNYIYKPINDVDVIIKGVIRNNDLIEILTRLKFFEKNIKRIITTSMGNNADIFIELEINKYLKNAFEEKIDDLGWKINK